jgi:hypothetical protein
VFAQHQHMGMHQHSAAKIEIQNDATTDLLTVRLGPVAGTSSPYLPWASCWVISFPGY